MASQAWSIEEVSLIVSDYIDMLTKEISGRYYSKTEHRKSLSALLNNRSDGSIEFKHQNISAVLVNLGLPYIKGHLPRYNYQLLLEDEVINQLSSNESIEQRFMEFSDNTSIEPVLLQDWHSFEVNPPEFYGISETSASYGRRITKVNYLEREQNNTALGIKGEEMALEYEKWNLIIRGKENLAQKIEWVSQTQGDGAGFDILSRYPNGKDKYIEVKI